MDAGADNAIGNGSPTLVVRREGDGSGSVISVPAGIDCGPTCAASFKQTTAVLEAIASPDSDFTGWKGRACGGTAPCLVPLKALTTVTATFTPKLISPRFSLTVARVGVGTGIVTGGSISCGTSCTSSLPEGASLTITAIADPGSLFAGWNGCPSATGSSSPSLTGPYSAVAAVSAG